jgi:hypothetical protein
MTLTINFSNLRAGEILAGIGGLAMFGFLFIDWYGGDDLITSPGGVDGWRLLVDFPGYLVILSALVAVKFAGLALMGLRVNLPLQRGMITFALGWIASTIVLWRMVAGGPSLKVGIFLGLASTVTITVGAWLAMRADGFDVLVPSRERRSAGARKRG